MVICTLWNIFDGLQIMGMYSL